MRSPEDPNFAPEQLAEVSALADGSIDPARAAEVEAKIKASPELSALYDRERQVVGLLHRAAAAHRAPANLRAQLEGRRRTEGARAPRRLSFGAAIAALAAVAVVLVSVLPGGAPAAPSVSEAAVLASRGATAPPPAPDEGDPATQLAQQVGGVYFPNWAASVGWRAVGQRADRLRRRQMVTVYYRSHGRDLAYSIVEAPALEQPRGQIAHVGNTETRTLTINGRTIVTWRRAGQTCVLSSAGVPADTLRRLAAWPTPALSARAAGRRPASATALLSAFSPRAGEHGANAW